MITHKTLLQSQMQSVWYLGLLSPSYVKERLQSGLRVLSVFISVTTDAGNEGRHNPDSQQVNGEGAFDHLSQRIRRTLSYILLFFSKRSQAGKDTHLP